MAELSAQQKRVDKLVKIFETQAEEGKRLNADGNVLATDGLSVVRAGDNRRDLTDGAGFVRGYALPANGLSKASFAHYMFRIPLNVKPS